MPEQEKKVVVVDKNNTIIGHKYFGELTDNDIWRIIAIWAENDKGQVLLQRRALHMQMDPGLWTPAVAGTVDEGDDWLSTAIREAEEEIGLTNVTFEPTELMFFKSVFGSRWCQGYKVAVDWPVSRFVIQQEEVAELGWFDKERVINEITAGSPKYPAAASVWLNLFNLV